MSLMCLIALGGWPQQRQVERSKRKVVGWKKQIHLTNIEIDRDVDKKKVIRCLEMVLLCLILVYSGLGEFERESHEF